MMRWYAYRLGSWVLRGSFAVLMVLLVIGFSTFLGMAIGGGIGLIISLMALGVLFVGALMVMAGTGWYDA